MTIEFDTEGLAADFAQSVRATGEVILGAGDSGIEEVCAAEVVEEKRMKTALLMRETERKLLLRRLATDMRLAVGFRK